jgi:predicted NBD/HSP70 family sugar kinase
VRKIDVENFQRATRDTSRDVNRTIALNLVREHGPLSRADLSRRMGVSRGMITPLVNELLEEGLIYEGDTAQAPRGRRPTLLHLRYRDRLVVAVDLRASHTAVQISDFAGTPLDCRAFPTPADPARLLDRLAAEVADLAGLHEGTGTCEGIGLVVPGMVDVRSGRILNLPTLGWRDLDLCTPLSRRTGLAVSVERDAVACAMARIWMDAGGAGEPRDFAYLVVSDGVGAGLVMHGEPVRGRHFTAGEFGHVPVQPDGPLCTCGHRGCLEALASDVATLARYLGLPYEGRTTRARVQESGVEMAHVLARAAVGEPRARAAVEATADWVGLGVSLMVAALNPETIAVGGALTEAWDLVGPRIRAVVRGRALTPDAAATRIVVDPDHAATRLQGAASLVVAPVFAAPSVG